MYHKPRPQSVAILGLGDAFPDSIPQHLAATIAADLCTSDPRQSLHLAHLFQHTGIQQRGSVLADSPNPLGSVRTFYSPRTSETDLGPSTADRMSRYQQHAPPLAQSAARSALADACLEPSQITDLITVSCTGFFAPGLDASLIRDLGLRPSIHRLHIGFMGCHAAFNAIATAADLCFARPQARILIVCVELCSLHFAYGWDPQRLAANALFSDGAAALILGRDPDAALQLLSSGSLLLPDSHQAMTWQIGDHGFEMKLSAEVPSLIARHLHSWLEPWLRQHGRLPADIPHWAIHPGGPKILTSICQALGLPPGAAGLSRETLAQHGNMSSATIPIILAALRREHPQGDCVALGFGPGLMAETLLLHFGPQAAP